MDTGLVIGRKGRNHPCPLREFAEKRDGKKTKKPTYHGQYEKKIRNSNVFVGKVMRGGGSQHKGNSIRFMTTIQRGSETGSCGAPFQRGLWL